MEEKTLGQIGYEAYFKFTGGVSLVTKYRLPEWPKLNAYTKEAWESAADAVRRSIYG